MYCEVCGHNLAEGSCFCPKCGRPLSDAKAANEVRVTQSPRPWTIWVSSFMNWGMCALIFLGLLAVLAEEPEIDTELLSAFLFFATISAATFLMFFRLGWARIFYAILAGIFLLGCLALVADDELYSDGALGLVVIMPTVIMTVIFSYLPVSNAWFRRR